MAVYDGIALEYANVFDNIALRRFEWPWLRGLIAEHKPHSLLELGCGNGYLLEALSPSVPDLYAVEPCQDMVSIARERLGQTATLCQASAESLPFADGSFDMAVSLLSFRYMDWERAVGEIHRLLKTDGVFILVDLFAARFNPLLFGKYCATWAGVRLQYAGNREYRHKLKELSRNPQWRNMTQEHPKRELADARRVIEQTFTIRTEKLLSAGLRGKTVGLVCVKQHGEKETACEKT